MQTAVRRKSCKVIAREQKMMAGKTTVTSQVLEFRQEVEDSLLEEEVRTGLETGLYDKIKPKRCRPTALPNAGKIIDDFIKIAGDEIAKGILKKDCRKRSKDKRDSFKALETINKKKE